MRSQLSDDGLQHLNAADAICLVTIMKSGTHWLRYLFANYFKIMAYGDDCPSATYEELQTLFSPNDRRSCLRDCVQPVKSPIFPMFRFRDVMWQHVSEDITSFKGRIVFLFRNPLDYIISRYHYDQSLWKGEGRDVSSPAATMEWALYWYAENLSFMRTVLQERASGVVMTYENLKAAPEVSFEILLRSLSIPVCYSALKLAVQRSDSTMIAAEEVNRGAAIVGPTTTGYFVRDASVGQWRKYMSDQDLEIADKILSGYGIRLAHFQLG